VERCTWGGSLGSRFWPPWPCSSLWWIGVRDAAGSARSGLRVTAQGTSSFLLAAGSTPTSDRASSARGHDRAAGSVGTATTWAGRVYRPAGVLHTWTLAQRIEVVGEVQGGFPSGVLAAVGSEGGVGDGGVHLICSSLVDPMVAPGAGVDSREGGVANTDVAIVRRKVSGRQLAGLCLVVLSVLGIGYAVASSGGVGPSMRTEATSYQPGDHVDLQLRNGLRPAGYNLCFAFVTLQGHGASGWVTVAADLGPSTGDLVACTGELRPLPPLGGAQATVHLPPDLPTGEYRLVHELEVSGHRRAVATDAFTVGRDA
jgi:hypothetical protein